jgi:hypothetical protein
MKRICSILFIAVAVILLGACGSDSFDDAHTIAADSMPFEPAPPPPPVAPPPPMQDMPQTADGMFAGASTAAEWEALAAGGGRHIIQNASVTLESEIFEPVVASLRIVAEHFGGYVENEMLTNTGARVFSIVLRVPAAHFEIALAHVQSLANVRTSQQHAQDVTEQFHDAVASLEVRRIEEDRVLALIENATEIGDILALEARLGGVRLAISQYEAALAHMAGQISYSTISVTLFDMYEEEEEEIVIAAGTWENITSAFGDSVAGIARGAQGFAVWLAGAILPIIVVAVLVIALWRPVKKLVVRN